MSTERKRDWVDYAGLASQLYQNHQINDVRDKVAAVGQIALAKEMREQQADADKQRVEQARDVLFTYCSVFQRLKKMESTNLRGSLLIAKNLDRYVKNSGLATGDFPDFEDKQRLTDLKEDVTEYIERCTPKLSVEDREKLALCERYYQEEEVFDRAAQRMREYEETQKLFERYEELKDAQPYRNPSESVVVVVGFLAVLVCTALAAIYSPAGSLLPVIVWVVCIGLTVLFFVAVRDPDQEKALNAIYQEKLELEEHLRGRHRESPLSAFPAVITALGPGCDSRAVRREIQRRERFIEQVGDEHAESKLVDSADVDDELGW